MAWSESTLKSRLLTVINAMSTTIVNVFYSYSGLSLPSKMKTVQDYCFPFGRVKYQQMRNVVTYATLYLFD